jgi:pyruvate dehydrogenase E1 component
VPIVADEAPYLRHGQPVQAGRASIRASASTYEPEDIGSVLSYREAKDGQILEEGISEASAISSWVAAATSYSVHGVAMLPFYIYYSMFGFQRVGDLIWAAADQRRAASCSARLPAARPWAAKACSTRTAAAT